MINNDNNNEREIKMIQQTLTDNELDAMVASMQSAEVELDENDTQCAKIEQALASASEYEHYEANWEELESDDGHLELYID